MNIIYLVLYLIYNILCLIKYIMSYKIYKNYDNIMKKEYIFGFDLDNTLTKFNLNTDKYVLLYDKDIIINKLIFLKNIMLL